MTIAHDSYKEAEELEDLGYKARRDGRLMASIANARQAEERMGSSGGSVVLLSSASPLRRAENRFRRDFGEARVLFSVGALSYLLASVPDAGLGADSLRLALFEFGRTAKLKDAGRRALRIIRATEQYDIPWAERGLLVSDLSAAIRKEAEKRGVREEDLRARLASGAEPKTGARLISQALEKLVIKDKTTEELAEAHKTISHLERQIVELEESLKTARNAAPRTPDL